MHEQGERHHAAQSADTSWRSAIHSYGAPEGPANRVGYGEGQSKNTTSMQEKTQLILSR